MSLKKWGDLEIILQYDRKELNAITKYGFGFKTLSNSCTRSIILRIIRDTWV